MTVLLPAFSPDADDCAHKHEVDEVVAGVDGEDLKRVDLKDICLGPADDDETEPYDGDTENDATESSTSSREEISQDRCRIALRRLCRNAGLMPDFVLSIVRHGSRTTSKYM